MNVYKQTWTNSDICIAVLNGHMHPEINHVLYQHFLHKITKVKYSDATSLLGVTEYKPAQPFTNILKWMCKKRLQVIEQTVK